MMSLRLRILTLLLISSSSALPWTAGFEQIDLINIQDIKEGPPVYLAGYGKPGSKLRFASGIHDPVYASSLYLTDDRLALLFISLDTIGFSQKLGETLRQEISRAIDIKRENILISATHTHSAPDTQGLWGGLTPELMSQMVNRIVTSAKAAYKKRQTSTLSVLISNNGNTRNRRLLNKQETIDQITHIVISTPHGQATALLSSFASHPTVLREANLQVSSDWLHSYRKRLAEQFQMPEPNVLFINGVLGDVLPYLNESESWVERFELAESYGLSIANSVGSPPVKLETHLQHCTEEIEVFPDNHELITWLTQNSPETVLWTENKTLKTRVSVVRLGHITFATVPGEPVTQLGQAILMLRPLFPVVILGLTHDSLGYLLPLNDTGLSETSRQYEEKWSLAKGFGHRVLQTIEQLMEKCSPEALPHALPNALPNALPPDRTAHDSL
ncbi:MAG: neutral/alkaline non-lysosomal ceramidase N-terminal domain-containing protein [Endozoicomonas sp.]